MLLFHKIFTILFFLIFVFFLIWIYSPKRKGFFENKSMIIFKDIGKNE